MIKNGALFVLAVVYLSAISISSQALDPSKFSSNKPNAVVRQLLRNKNREPLKEDCRLWPSEYVLESHKSSLEKGEFNPRVFAWIEANMTGNAALEYHDFFSAERYSQTVHDSFISANDMVSAELYCAQFAGKDHRELAAAYPKKLTAHFSYPFFNALLDKGYFEMAALYHKLNHPASYLTSAWLKRKISPEAVQTYHEIYNDDQKLVYSNLLFLGNETIETRLRFYKATNRFSMFIYWWYLIHGDRERALVHWKTMRDGDEKYIALEKIRVESQESHRYDPTIAEQYRALELYEMSLDYIQYFREAPVPRTPRQRFKVVVHEENP